MGFESFDRGNEFFGADALAFLELSLEFEYVGPLVILQLLR